MGPTPRKLIDYLIVDTTAFIQNAALQEIAENIITCPEVVNEITNRRQLRRLVVLPYDLNVKEVFPENVRIVTEFAKKTGDYPSLSATDIRIIALTYQLEKEKIGTSHIRLEPVMQKPIVSIENTIPDMNPDVTGFFLPGKSKTDTIQNDNKKGIEIQENCEKDGELQENNCVQKNIYDEELNMKFESLKCSNETLKELDNEILSSVVENSSDEYENDDTDDEGGGWITPANVEVAKKHVNSDLIEEKHVAVACITTDFAMQNVLRQMNLNICALDGRIIKQLRTYILRCYTCFKTTSLMTKKFCPKCGNNTLKKVAVSLDQNGKTRIHINPKRPLTARGKKFSLPRIKGGKHPNNPILVEDQPMPHNRPSRLAIIKNNPLGEDYIAGFSPFVMRDVNSKSAQLCIRPHQEFKQWMKKNPNESHQKRK